MRRALVAAAISIGLLAWPATAPATPLGANDSSCTPNALLHPHPLGTPADHPHRPVVLVHATWVNADTMTPLSLALRAAGYCPWADDYPTGMDSDGDAPDDIADFVDDVLASTSDGHGTGEVSMVGHSQGGMQIRHMLMHHDKPVEDAISLASPHKGSAHPLGGFCTNENGCPDGLPEQRSTSPFFDHLNPGCSGDGVLDDMDCWAPLYGDADYTNVVTLADELLFPHWRGLMGPYPTQLSATDPRVTDVTLQAWCPAAATDHLGIIADPHVLRLILDALARSGPADASIPCSTNL